MSYQPTMLPFEVPECASAAAPRSPAGQHAERPPSRADLRELPPVIDLITAAGILGIGRTKAYELVHTSRWPTPILRLDRRIRIPTAALLDLIGERRTP